MTSNQKFEIINNEIKKKFIKKNKPIRLGINGIEGTGKTTFAINLTKYLNEHINAIHISIDGYHYNKAHRYKKGRDSYKGYYEDAYNEKDFVDKVLISSLSKIPHYVKSIHNLKTDEYLNLEPEKIENKTVLITDGSYLFKPVFLKHWDYKIYLKTDFNTAMLRGIERDKNLLGNKENAKEKYFKRYHKASLFYNNECQPESNANLVIDNTEFDNLIIQSKD